MSHCGLAVVGAADVSDGLWSAVVVQADESHILFMVRMPILFMVRMSMLAMETSASAAANKSGAFILLQD
jgi:hypothetical protein